MNAKTAELLETCVALLKLFESFDTAQIPGLTAAVENLADEVKRVNVLAVRQFGPWESVFLTRDEQIEGLMQHCLVLAGRAFSHAHRTGDVALAKSVHVVRSDFMRVGVAQRIVVAEQVHSALASAVERLGDAGITAAEIAELHAHIQAGLEAAVVPRTARADHAEVTAQIKAATRRMMELLRFQIDPLMHALRTSDPALFERYCSTRRVIRRRGGRRKKLQQAGAEIGEQAETLVAA